MRGGLIGFGVSTDFITAGYVGQLEDVCFLCLLSHMFLKRRANNDSFCHKTNELFYIIEIEVNFAGSRKRREHREG